MPVGSGRRNVGRGEKPRAQAVGVERLDVLDPEGGELAQLQPEISTWRVPALALLKGTSLGATAYSFYQPAFRGGLRMEDRFDAVLYVGPVSQVTVRRGEIAPSLCGDSAYMKLRLARMALIDPPDRPRLVSPAEALMRYCASVRSSPTRGEPR